MGVVFFLIFKDCLRIFVIFVNVDMCKTVLIAGEGTDCAAIFIELLKCFCEVLTIIFTMHVYVWWRIRGTISGEKGGGEVGLPYSFLNIEKIALIIWEKALIVFIRRLNVHLGSSSKCYIKSI